MQATNKTAFTSARLLKGRPPDPEEKSNGQIQAPELLAKAEDAKRPAAVQNDRMHAVYLGLGLERDRNKKKLVHLDFSLTLDESHNVYLPEKLRDAWRWLVLSGNKLVEVRGIPSITLDVWSTPTKKEPLLHLAGAHFAKAIVSIREESGKGKTIEVVRLSFRVLVPRSDEVMAFACWSDTEEFWIALPTTQREMAAKA